MSSGIYDLRWGHDLAARISPGIKVEVGRIRRDPSLIPIVSGKSNYEDVVQDLSVIAGPALSIRPSAKLAPVKISSAFRLAQQQFADEGLAGRLALRPASHLAFAEDAIILHGRRATITVAALPIIDENTTLGEQDGLFYRPPPEIPLGKPITDSILQGLETLQSARHYGPYCVIVSPDLHREAMTPLARSSTPCIAPILPHLREDGFRFSDAATPRTGVIFSLGGAAVDLPIPWDAHVECRTVAGDATFVVVEQFRLRINDPRAVATLR
jgi:hypothetical protein